jgi:hypothetical protein
VEFALGMTLSHGFGDFSSLFSTDTEVLGICLVWHLGEDCFSVTSFQFVQYRSKENEIDNELRILLIYF